MSNVYMHSNPDPENQKGLQGKKNHTHAHKYSLKLSHTRAPTHTDKPALEAYFPAPHDVQVAAAEEVDPSGPYLPAAHKEPEQVEGVVAPTAAEYLPASQSMQTAEPGVRPQRQTTGHFHVHVRNERRRLSCENGCALRIGWACKS